MRGYCIECKEISDNFTPKQIYCSVICKQTAKQRVKLEKWAQGGPRKYKAINRLGEIQGISVR